MKLAVLLVWLGACAGAAGTQRGPLTGLRLRCEPTEATVFVDDEYQGPCAVYARRPLALAPGTHRLQVEAGGHYPHYAEVEVGRAVRALEIRLLPRPD